MKLKLHDVGFKREDQQAEVSGANKIRGFPTHAARPLGRLDQSYQFKSL